METRSSKRPTRLRSLSLAGPRKHESTKRNVFFSCFRVFVANHMSLGVAVIGVGHLGKHHARILSTLPGVELVAVVDTNESRAREVAAASRPRAAVDYRDVI